MALSTSGKNDAVAGVIANAVYLSLHSSAPDGSGSAEISGGSPAYARQSITWGSPSNGAAAASNSPFFDVPAATTVTHAGFWNASSGGTFKGSQALSASETFAAQGTYTATGITYTQS
jgi:hypothetical protein